MRILVVVLGLIGALTMIEHALIPTRIAILTGGEIRTIEQVASLGLFALWAVAAGLVYRHPTVAMWTFAVAGALGLFAGLETGYRVLLVWGVLANGMAMVTTLARREKRLDDRREYDRDRWLLAMSVARPSWDASLMESPQAVRLPDAGEFAPVLRTPEADGQPRLPV